VFDAEPDLGSQVSGQDRRQSSGRRGPRSCRGEQLYRTSLPCRIVTEASHKIR